jgi:ATP-dependent DNA ligase
VGLYTINGADWSKRYPLDAPYRSGPSKSWIKVKNPKATAATRAIDGTF